MLVVMSVRLATAVLQKLQNFVDLNKTHFANCETVILCLLSNENGPGKLELNDLKAKFKSYQALK